MTKKYGGYSVSAIEEFIDASEEIDESIDYLAGDDATSCLIIKDLLAEVKRLEMLPPGKHLRG